MGSGGSIVFGPPDGWGFEGGPGWSLDPGDRPTPLKFQGGTGWSLLYHGEEARSLDDGGRGQKLYGPPEGDGSVVLSPGEQGMPILH